MKHRKIRWTAAVGVIAMFLPLNMTRAQDSAQIVPETEEADVATLPAPAPHWAYLIDGWFVGGTRIVDGDSGKIRGIVHNQALANFAIDPKGRYYYMAESIWTKGNRGTRQDLLTIYDAATLKLVTDIALPGRLLIGNRIQNLTVSADGRYAYVYNMDPASSIIVVDLEKRKYLTTVEVPGCGLAIPAPDGTTHSLCSDGSMATVSYAGKGGKVSRTPVFFSAEHDPIFDNSFVDTTTGKAFFLTYSGLIYDAQLGAKPVIGEPWSLQQAADLPAGVAQPLTINWFPGGREPMAFHRESGKAYVLMHMGEFCTQKEPGTELWEVDVAARKVLRRLKLEDAVDNVVVTQGADPLLFLNTGKGKLYVFDAATFTQKHMLEEVGSGNLHVAGN
jgi:methylamine dehydrogenase heavy chain